MKQIKPEPSIFHIFSLGYVVEDNHSNCFSEPIIKVLPLEYLSNEKIDDMLFKIRVELNNGTTEQDIKKLVNSEKVKAKVKKIIESVGNNEWKKIDKEYTIERYRWVPAVWASISTYNEFNPPPVNRGDIVMIYKYGDMNTYFWEALFKRVLEENKKSEGSIRRFVSSENNKLKTTVTNTICSDDISFRIDCCDINNNIYNYLELYKGNFNYIDQLGNMFVIGQDGIIYTRGNKDIFQHANNNVYITSGSKIDIAPANLLSIETNNIVMKANGGININGGSAFGLKAMTISLQGNVVVNGNLTVTGSVVPGGCPCCCKCSPGGGGGGNLHIAQPDETYKEIDSNSKSTYSDIKKSRADYINSITTFVKKTITAIINKVGLGKINKEQE